MIAGYHRSFGELPKLESGLTTVTLEVMENVDLGSFRVRYRPHSNTRGKFKDLVIGPTTVGLPRKNRLASVLCTQVRYVQRQSLE